MPEGPVDDVELVRHALAAGASVRGDTSPAPWVGCVVRTPDGRLARGATQDGASAVAAALRVAGDAARGATVAITLEPEPADASALCRAGVARVVVALDDPSRPGQGVAALRDAGIDVVRGVLADAAAEQLAAFVHHRRTGRPLVVLVLAAGLDGRLVPPSALGAAAWTDRRRLRAESDAVLVDPESDVPDLTARGVPGRDPRCVVLGRAPERLRPCLELDGPLTDVLDRLGGEGVLQVVAEPGPGLAARLHEAGLVDRYRWYLAPVVGIGPPVLGEGAPWRGEIHDVVRLGDDIGLEVRQRGDA